MRNACAFVSNNRADTSCSYDQNLSHLLDPVKTPLLSD
jgi:hypothetical protein